MVGKFLVAVALVVFVLQPRAQDGSPPAFEVASIKRNVSGGPSRGRTAGGHFTATNAPVLQLIWLAHGNLSPDRILNVPGWVTSEHYDIVAKAPEGVQLGPAMGPLMRSLLRERFAFEAHSETRDMPIYELVLARRDGRLGARLQRAACDCTGNRAEPGCKRGVPAPSVPEFDGLTCVQMGVPGRWFMRGYPLLNFFRDVNGRPVVDRTGLAGPWNLDLEFTPDEVPPIGDRPAGTPPPPDNAPSLFTAMEEQLGLKLQPARGPAEVLVVDRIERPTSD